MTGGEKRGGTTAVAQTRENVVQQCSKKKDARAHRCTNALPSSARAHPRPIRHSNRLPSLCRRTSGHGSHRHLVPRAASISRACPRYRKRGHVPADSGSRGGVRCPVPETCPAVAGAGTSAHHCTRRETAHPCPCAAGKKRGVTGGGGTSGGHESL